MTSSGKGNTQRFSMTKNVIRILLVFIPVLILVIYLLRERLPFGGSNSSFSTDPEKEITRIEFLSDTSRLALEKEGNDWLVNGRYQTRKTSILFILRILTGLEIKSPVSSELFYNEIDSKGVTPVKVKVYHGRKLLKSFLVFRTNSNVYGNIMKLREGSKPFIVFIQGSETEIGSAFNTNELFWQPFTVFELLPSQISSVTFENMKEPGSSFMIRIRDRGFELSDLRNNMRGWDTSKVERYLSYFTHVPFETWALDLSPGDKENIKSGQPLFRITVIKQAGESIVLNLWERLVNKDGSERVDSDRLWANTEGGKEIFVVRYIDIDPLLKKISYFYPD